MPLFPSGRCHRLLPSLACAAFCTGCTASLLATARDTFSGWYSCPADQVRVTDRGADNDVPPPEVAQDPERLRLWKDRHSGGPARELYEVEGCGHRRVYVCRHGSGDEDDIGLLQAKCFLAAVQPVPSPEEIQSERRQLESVTR
jgi:hypothetical protein